MGLAHELLAHQADVDCFRRHESPFRSAWIDQLRDIADVCRTAYRLAEGRRK